MTFVPATTGPNPSFEIAQVPADQRGNQRCDRTQPVARRNRPDLAGESIRTGSQYPPQPLAIGGSQHRGAGDDGSEHRISLAQVLGSCGETVHKPRPARPTFASPAPRKTSKPSLRSVFSSPATQTRERCAVAQGAPGWTKRPPREGTDASLIEEGVSPGSRSGKPVAR